jgi:hypothetical protein
MVRSARKTAAFVAEFCIELRNLTETASLDTLGPSSWQSPKRKRKQRPEPFTLREQAPPPPLAISLLYPHISAIHSYAE